jgi:hypothetical protein
MLRRSLVFSSPRHLCFSCFCQYLTARALFVSSWQKAGGERMRDLCLLRGIQSTARECNYIPTPQRSEATQGVGRILAFEANEGAERLYSARGTGQACAQSRRWQASSSTFQQEGVEGAKQRALARKRSQPTKYDYVFNASLRAGASEGEEWQAKPARLCRAVPDAPDAPARVSDSHHTCRATLTRSSVSLLYLRPERRGRVAGEASEALPSGARGVPSVGSCITHTQVPQCACVVRGHEHVCVARSRACVVHHVSAVFAILQNCRNSKILKILKFLFQPFVSSLKKFSGAA